MKTIGLKQADGFDAQTTKIVNVLDPTNDQDAATKKYVDDNSGGSGDISGSGTANQIAYFTGEKAIASLTTDTYPSLTELSYVKGVTSAVQTQLDAKQSQIINNVKDFGATGDGSTDDTSAIEDALSEGGITFFPAGTYKVTGLSLPSGAHLLGVGHGFYGDDSPATQRSIISLIDSSDDDVLFIPKTHSYGSIEGIEIDGNKNNNSSGIGINFEDGDSAEECGWIIRNVEVREAAGTGIYLGNNRQNFYGERIIVVYCNEHGVHSKGSDAHWVNLSVGNSGWKNIVAGGYVTRFIGGNCWNANEIGVVIVAPLVSIFGMGIDRNDEEGVLVDTGSEHVSIIGCQFHSNGQAADDTYSDIKLNVNGNTVTIQGNNFGPLDGGITNKRRYAIEVGSNAVLASGNTHDTDATGTSFTDAPDKINQNIGIASIELGHVSDTTLSRAAAGDLAVEGVSVLTTSNSKIVTNKRVQPRTASSTTDANLTPDLSSANVYYRTTQTGTLAINEPTGTPVIGEVLMLYISAAGAQTINWNAAYIPYGAALPTTTVAGKTLMVSSMFNGTNWQTLTAVAI